MRTQSNTQPSAAFQIEKINDSQCDILFYENVEPIEKEEQLNYEYEMYRLPAIYRENLSASVEENYNEWLTMAKLHEELQPKLTVEEEVMMLNHTQFQQDAKITTSLMANTELFEMILGMMPMTATTKNTKGVSQMVEVYVALILEGKKTLEQVPTIIRGKVEQQLKELGIIE